MQGASVIHITRTEDRVERRRGDLKHASQPAARAVRMRPTWGGIATAFIAGGRASALRPGKRSHYVKPCMDDLKAGLEWNVVNEKTGSSR